MAVTTEARAPAVRSLISCRSSKVQALCHQSPATLGCARHVRPSPRWAERTIRRGGRRSRGGEHPRLGTAANCNHVQAGWWLQVGTAGLAMLLTGLLDRAHRAVPVSLVIGLPMIVVGGATAAWAYAHVRRRSARARAERPVPLHPRVSSVRLLERLRTRIDLGPQGDCLIPADPVDGELTAILTFGADDVDRVRSYRDKRTLSADQQVRYTVGSFVPQGRLGISELRENQDR